MVQWFKNSVSLCNSPRHQVKKIAGSLSQAQFPEAYLFCLQTQYCFIVWTLQDLSKDTTLMASNGAVVKALDLFSVCLAFLGDKAMECINASGQRGKTYESRDVQWVVTVPAIWEPTAKEFMREAAYKVC